MSAKDGIVSALNRESDSKPPAIFTQSSTIEGMDRCGCSWPEAHTDPRSMAELACQTYEITGIPTVHVPFSVANEALGLGCDISFGSKTEYPVITGTPWGGGGVIPDVPDSMISIDEFLGATGPATVLSTLEILSRDESLFVVPTLCGPFDIMIGMFGLDAVVVGMMMEPERYTEWATILMPYLTAYSESLGENSDAVLLVESATTDLLSPEDCARHLIDNMAGILRTPGTAFSALHCCGSTLDIIDLLVGCGEDLLIPQASDCLEEYVRRVDGRVVLAGAVDPIGTMLSGTPDDVVRSARSSAEAGFDIIAPECGLSPFTPAANIGVLAHYRG